MRHTHRMPLMLHMPLTLLIRLTRPAAGCDHVVNSEWAEWSSHRATLVVDTKLYTPEALFRACYAFTDRCYLFLSEKSDHEVVVEFRPKSEGTNLREMVGTFGNELINQRLRADITRETRSIRELIVTQAFAEADLRDPAS